jgi:peptide-methionine (S)-S-oxide reductase
MANEIAILGGGCFWCTEAVFLMLRDVVSVLPGYAGGTIENPTYEDVMKGTTGHVEVVRIEFDPKQISFRDLLTVFFATHDPTTKDRQGNDVGKQYRSVVFYSTPEQKTKAEEVIREINDSSTLGAPIVTVVSPNPKFWPAEHYHRHYAASHPGNPYCKSVINPKLEKVQKLFGDLIIENVRPRVSQV